MILASNALAAQHDSAPVLPHEKIDPVRDGRSIDFIQRNRGKSASARLGGSRHRRRRSLPGQILDQLRAAPIAVATRPTQGLMTSNTLSSGSRRCPSPWAVMKDTNKTVKRLSITNR